MPKNSPESSRPPLEALPENLRMSVIRLMAKYGLDIDAAYEKLATLADANSSAFDEAVKAAGESLYKRRLMQQMNTARASINNAANARLSAEYGRGHGDGYAKGKADYQVYYYCNICDKIIYMEPNSEDHKAMVQYMFDRGWGHQACHEKNAYPLRQAV
jgi:hypothetical protein